MNRTPPPPPGVSRILRVSHWHRWLRIRVVFAIFLLVCGLRSWAEPESFELRAAVPFLGQSPIVIDSTNGGFSLPGTFSYAQPWNEANQSWDSYASLKNVPLDTAGQQWIFMVNGWQAVADAAALTAARNAGHVLWLDFNVPTVAGAATPFLVSSASHGHALGVVQPGTEGGPAVIFALPLGGEPLLFQPGEGENWPAFSAMGASALVDPAKPFWVVDFTTGLRGPTGATFLRDAWVADPANYPLASVSFYFGAVSKGERFTLHWQLPGQPEAMRSLTAAEGDTGWQQMGDWTTEDLTGTVCVTGSVALGANYWLTRDSDGWNTGALFLDPFAARPAPLRWSFRGDTAPPVPWQTVTFQIAEGFGWNMSVVQPDGTRTLSPVGSGVLTLADFDDWGNPHHFYYERWTAQIDPREAFWLTGNDTQCSEGETWFTAGWSAIRGLPRDMRTVAFGIDIGLRGTGPSVSDASGSQALTLESTDWQIQDWLADGTPNQFTYDLWNAVLDVNRPFFLTVNGTTLPASEVWFYNGWQRANAGADWQTVNFMLPRGWCYLSVPVVTQGAHSWVTTKTATGLIEDYWNDGSGLPNFFEYDLFSAPVDVNRPFTLTFENPATLYPLTLGENETAYTNGWARQGGQKLNRFTLSLSLPCDRAGHAFTLTEPDGTSWPLSLTDATVDPYSVTFTIPWGLNPPPGSTGMDWTLNTTSLSLGWSAVFSGTAGAWTLSDDTTGENQTFDPGTAHGYSLDARQWWPGVQPFALQVSLSRWSHDLSIRQRNGEEFSVEKLTSQGDLVDTPEGPWYQSYYLFSATGHRRVITGVDWWVYDATTQEYAALNATDLVNWHHTPPPAALAATQGDLTAVTITWQLPGHTEKLGGGFTIERRIASSDEWETLAPNTAANTLLVPETTVPLRFQFTDSSVQPGTYSYRITYLYGGQPSATAQVNATVFDAATLDTMDSDDDGITDLDEMLAANNPDYAPLSVSQDPVFISMTAGSTVTFTVTATGGFGARDLAYDGGQALQCGTMSSVTDNGDSITFEYTANGDAEDADTFTVTASDTYRQGANARSFTISINITPNPLIANEVDHWIPYGQPFSETLGATGGNAENYTFTITSEPVGFILYDAQLGTFTYTAGGVGSVSVTYTVSDGTNTSAPRTFYINIQPQQQPIWFAEPFPNSGFDSTTQPPWLMVPQGGMNWAKAITPAAATESVKFSIQPLPSEETVSPGTTNLSPETITVTGSHLGDSSKVTATVTSDPTITGDLKVSVKAYRHYNVVFYRVTQDSIGAVDPKVPTADDLRIYLNKVFGLQANIWFTVTKGNDVKMDYDVGGNPFAEPKTAPNGRLDAIESTDATKTTEEEKVLISQGSPNAINVFFVRNMTVYKLKSETNEYVPNAFATGNTRSNLGIYVTDFATDQLETTAHEIGHQLGLLGHVLPSTGQLVDQNNLMAPFKVGSPNAWRLVKEQWDIINP